MAKRVLKFRALCKGKWIYYGTGLYGTLDYTKADKKTESQFTGLLDCVGVEIYEGDILSDPSWWWGNRFVYYHRGECGPSKGDSVMTYLLAKDINDPLKGATYNIWNGKDVEVIGNIYESPEALK